ncbi:MAG TPA: ATP-binding protein [Anaerolineales bacterium]|nr:ATP-binding protein [Anaerolineales bacterium]
MQFLTTLLENRAYLNPLSIAGWMVWLGLAGLLLVLLLNWRKYQPALGRKNWGILTALIVAVPITALFFGFKLTIGNVLPIPGLPVEPLGSTMMIFSAIPWTLAGGLLGPLAAAGIGILSGVVQGVWDSHSFFTMIELALMGTLFAVANRQRYRTTIFRWLRMPLFSALSLVLVHAVLFLLGAFFTSVGTASVTQRLEYAFSNLGVISLAFGAEMFVAGLVAQLVTSRFPYRWGETWALQPSPAEKSIETRFMFGTGTIITLLLVTLLVGDWIVAGRAARRLLQERLQSSAQLASQNVPFFLETGQNLTAQIADDARFQDSNTDRTALLRERSQSVPFFNQLVLVDLASRSVLARYPANAAFQLTPPEEGGLSLIQQGVPNQVYTIPPVGEGEAAGASFLASIPQTGLALIGRTELGSNSYTRSLISSLDSLSEVEGRGLLTADGVIVYDSQGTGTWQAYEGQSSDQAAFFDETDSVGMRRLVYYQPVEGHPWAVVLSVPTQATQQLAIDIALPISLMIVLLGIMALVFLRVNLRSVIGSLQGLAAEARYLSTGKFDRPLTVSGEDEISDLTYAFEQMRVNLQARLQDLNRLLSASQGVASSLTLGEALRPVLEAVVANGARSASIVLMRDIFPTTAFTPVRFADGPEREVYMHLDHQILSLAEKQERVVMATVSRNRGLIFDPNLPEPESLIAIALRNERRYYGVLWAAYNKQHIFTDSDLRFISTLASQASLAVTNIRLYLTVEASRRQLEVILNSTPDPVLVTDGSNRLILANPAAEHVFGIKIGKDERPAIEKTITVQALNELLTSSSTERLSAEISMPDDRTFLAMESAMTAADGHPVGRVCILRDVTQLKEIDTLKSDFVSTVSHDLRSPLTLMRGYASMLEMAGELNDQQKNYARMITQGVDNMAKLVNNLLDLGRIDFGVGLQVESIPVLDIVERVTGSLQLQATQKKISLGVEIPRDLPHAVEADPALLQQALYNLVENALKYTPEGGAVTMHLQPTPTSLTFAVQDSGIGIPEGDLPRLFEKFYRGTHREALAQRGSGLGLAIVKSIAERHSGRAWVQSEPGKGSTFYLQIPLVQPKESRRIQ